jgi:hypothetical protein
MWLLCGYHWHASRAPGHCGPFEKMMEAKHLEAANELKRKRLGVPGAGEPQPSPLAALLIISALYVAA